MLDDVRWDLENDNQENDNTHTHIYIYMYTSPYININIIFYYIYIYYINDIMISSYNIIKNKSYMILGDAIWSSMGSRDHRIVVFSCRFLAIRDDNDGVINNLYPLVNIYKKLWKNTMISRWYIMVNQLFQWTMASTANCNKLPEGNQGAAHCICLFSSIHVIISWEKKRSILNLLKHQQSG